MAALDDYGPFDAGTGANRNEDFWRDFFRHLTGSGVIDGIGSEFAVAERGAGANMSVDVASGECFIRGHWGESTSTKNMAISAAHATLARIDRVVLRADFTANTISIEVVEGTPDAAPAAPALTQSSSRWEISLAQISVPAADTSIGSAQITSERTIIGFPTFDQSTAPADGDTWTYNATTGLWEPAASSGTSALELAHAQTTSTQTGIGTSITDLTGLSITPTIGANPVIIEGLVRFQMKVAAQPVIMEIYDSTAGVVVYQTAVSLGIDQYGAVYVKARVAPASGARTYKLRARTQLSNTCETQSAATSPAFIRCEEVMT